MGVSSSRLPGSDLDTTDSTGIRGGTDAIIIGNSGNRLLTQTTYADDKFIDSVGRLRVSDVSIIASQCMYSGPRDLDFLTSATGSATGAFVANAAAFRLTCTTGATDTIIRQTRRYYSYASGIGHSYGLALTVGAKKNNVRQRWGHFDALDGTFFEQTSSDLAIVVRSSTSGSAVDTRVVQANWNLDKLDGTGTSGINLNTAYHNKYIIDMSWYGAGRVRFGIQHNGQTFYCHEVNGANVTAAPYKRTPKLPIRFELSNLAATASTTTMDLVCTSAIQESTATFLPSYNFSKAMGRTPKSISSTLVPIISLQPLANFNGITNRSSIVPNRVQILAEGQSTFVQILINATLTGASFSSVNAFSAAQTDTSATAFSGGTVLAEFYIEKATQGEVDLRDFGRTLVLSNTIAGASGDIFTVAAQSLAGGTDTFATIQWEEDQ